ncbi:twin-arginine translocase TatA/TatE family subunit [Pseudoglutamicibacter cumminsii]|uniref:Twin-arginine translocase TatA/TatE family subunit n=1 Tax=Pseudoglutamicibacter cumminsii TaxID=156979 RepID=A0AAP4C6S0_9MICC|nr:twin-arginine translocase TatA/TatE family subunit [Pseudoglutamicibacter cumminsii]MDK6275343.1 twin-arginine translocase TatA/TatE family subunit [Pseudoglutamicibacter cumminsii]
MEFFGINGAEFLILGILAVVILGPDKLPEYTRKLADFIKGVRNYASTAKERFQEEMGDEVKDVDWRKLDPRQYDPRKIIRDALFEDDDAPAAPAQPAASQWKPQGLPNVAAQDLLPADEPAPFDDEAT